ncbi:MAG: hypothetical protein HZC47_10195 [Methanobacterium sp.]|uniref:hypothetical protein n=1 Tax=Methanobacterium sp. TaxID=2164 RepID=UPI003D653FB6|nr:hypothetical protein [Methanobacterium sp.]
MSNFKLNLPTDIPWERICVTEDMIDRKVCDDILPSKWQSSLAVFKYVPGDDCQLLPDYNITYLKVTATITGYQPLDEEIQGQINWDGLNVETIPGLTELLNSYNPCHGAILQVVVGPKDPEEKIQLKDHPFFLDFEPKKRELYELATDTKEKQSRSLESLNITKSGGSAQSQEIFDIDMGESFGYGSNFSYGGTGGGINLSGSKQGEHGTKRMNSEESMSSRSSDVGQEKRESFSFSTQISQMYHLLDSYHLGTNRVVFFIQPRPHVLEEPTGFVKGPRPIDGIQEFFMIVAHSKEQKDFCVSLRLDTSHLTKTQIMDYDRKSEVTQLAHVDAPIPTNQDIKAEKYNWGRTCVETTCWDIYYQCFVSKKFEDSVTYNAPSGYIIESYDDLINESDHGSSDVVITPNRASLNINVEAQGHNCYRVSDCVYNCPAMTIQGWGGSARRQLQVNLKSTTPTVKTGEEEVMLITTRGLCCCSSDLIELPYKGEVVVGIRAIPSHLQSKVLSGESLSTGFENVRNNLSDNLAQNEVSLLKDGNDKIQKDYAASDSKSLIRQVNELSNFIKAETIKSMNDPFLKPQKFIETDFFAQQLEYKLRQTEMGRSILNKSAVKDLPKESMQKLEKHLKKDAKNITNQDIMKIQNAKLAKITGINEERIYKLKLQSVGVKFHKETDKKNER